MINNHSVENLIDDFEESMVTCRWFTNTIAYSCYISHVEPKNMKVTLKEEACIHVM